MDLPMGQGTREERKEQGSKGCCGGRKVEGGEGNRRTPKVSSHNPNYDPPPNLSSIIRATYFFKQRSPWNATRAGALGAEVPECPVGRKVHELEHNPDDHAGIEE